MARDVLGDQGSTPGSIYGEANPSAQLWFDSAAGIGGVSSASCPDGILFYTPIVVQRAGTIDTVSIEVITPAAGNNLRVGLYADGGGMPYGPLLWQSGAIDGSTVGVKNTSVTSGPVTDAPKLWWVGLRVWGAAVTMRTFSGASPHTFGIGRTSGNNCIMYRSDAAGTSTLPDPASVVTSLDISFGPAAMIRIAP